MLRNNSIPRNFCTYSSRPPRRYGRCQPLADPSLHALKALLNHDQDSPPKLVFVRPVRGSRRLNDVAKKHQISRLISMETAGPVARVSANGCRCQACTRHYRAPNARQYHYSRHQLVNPRQSFRPHGMPLVAHPSAHRVRVYGPSASLLILQPAVLSQYHAGVLPAVHRSSVHRSVLMAKSLNACPKYLKLASNWV